MTITKCNIQLLQWLIILQTLVPDIEVGNYTKYWCVIINVQPAILCIHTKKLQHFKIGRRVTSSPRLSAARRDLKFHSRRKSAWNFASWCGASCVRHVAHPAVVSLWGTVILQMQPFVWVPGLRNHGISEIQTRPVSPKETVNKTCNKDQQANNQLPTKMNNNK